MTIRDAVRERILSLCSERNITVNKLASICGVTQSTLNNIISGRNKSATVTTIQKICLGLGISLVQFFDDSLFYHLEQEIE